MLSILSSPSSISFCVREFLIFCFLFLIFLAAITSNNNSLFGMSNWVVPDGQAYLDVMNTAVRSGFMVAIAELPEQFVGIPVNPALFAFYYPFAITLGGLGYFFANYVCLRLISAAIGGGAFLIVPYFLISIVLPSKDIMVLGCSALLLGLASRGKFLGAGVIVLLTFMFRDGAGVVALGILFTAILFKTTKVSPTALIIIFFLFALVINSLLTEVFGDFFLVARNLNLANDVGVYDIGSGGVGSFLLRIFGNSTNLAFRPSFLDMQGNVSLLSICYWVSGVGMLVAIFYSLNFLFFDRDRNRKLLPIMFFSSLIIISLNPLVQPRYQLPFAVLMLADVLKNENKNRVALIFFCMAAASVIAMGIYAVTGIGLPPPYERGTSLNYSVYFK